MKNMRYFVPLIFAALFCLSSCAESSVDSDINAPIQEGIPTTISMSFRVQEMNKHTRADLGALEDAITSIAVFVFDNLGQVVSQTIHENAGAHASSGDNVLDPDGIDKITIETFTGSQREIYVITNYHSNLIEGMRSVASKADISQLMIEMLGNPLDREFGMCKVGSLPSTDIMPGQTLSVMLQYTSAKITLKVINKCPELQISGWAADALPLKSYVVERPYNTIDPTIHDAVDVRYDADFYRDFADQSLAFEKQPNGLQFGNPTNAPEYSTTFYMYENRRGGRLSKSLPAGWIEPNVATDFRLKSWFAPQGATRLRILGLTQAAGLGTQSFLLNHFLGANNYDDYNVARGTHYTYTITINGLNDVNIDTNVEQSDLSLEVLPPADLMNFDAHIATRPFVLHTNIIKDPTISVSAEVLGSSGSASRPDWLDLTTASMLSQHIREESIPKINLWQQLGDDNTYVRPKFIPNMAQRAKYSYTPPVGVTLGSEQYPIDDSSLPYDKAHHRMCKKITNIPTFATLNSDESLPIYLYVSEYAHSSNVDYREAVVRFTVSKIGQEPEYINFRVRQYQSYLFAASPDNQNLTLLVERLEEYEHATHSVGPMGLQMNAGMQWGPYDIAAANIVNNGYNNTLLGVYKSITGNYYEAVNQLPKYGSLSGKWDRGVAKNGFIVEGAGATIPKNVSDDYSTPRADYAGASNLIYNTTAARYCHEKNADLNGDGNIDPSETFWYLPAVSEAQLFWTYRDYLQMKRDFYWTSTQTTSTHAYGISMLHESAAPHLIFSGVPQPLAKNFINTIGPPRVRCVRTTTLLAGGPIKPMVVKRADQSLVIDCSNMPSTMYTTITKNGVLQGNNGAVQDANQYVFKKLELQQQPNPTSDYYSLYFGDGKCNSTKGWRMPTQREMLMIYSVKSDIEQLTGTPFTEQRFWTMTRDMNAMYLVNFQTGLCEHGNYFDPAHKFSYRCVRELP